MYICTHERHGSSLVSGHEFPHASRQATHTVVVVAAVAAVVVMVVSGRRGAEGNESDGAGSLSSWTRLRRRPQSVSQSVSRSVSPTTHFLHRSGRRDTQRGDDAERCVRADLPGHKGPFELASLAR